jgi:hypothetical protein
MDLQVFVAIANIVNALAVTFTLAVLIVSIRQNTKSQKVLAVDSLAAAIASINVPAMESPVLGSAIAKATDNWDSASREECIMAHYFPFSFFKLSENAWYQQKAKILDRIQWLGWETLLRKYYHSEGVCQVWWPNRGHAYSQEFQRFLAETVPPDDIGSLSDLFDYVRHDA